MSEEKMSVVEILRDGLEKIRHRVPCPDPAEGGCIPSGQCANELADHALRRADAQMRESAENVKELTREAMRLIASRFIDFLEQDQDVMFGAPEYGGPEDLTPEQKQALLERFLEHMAEKTDKI